MGYYIRLLTPNPASVSIDQIERSLRAKVPSAEIQSVVPDRSNWTNFEIAQDEQTFCAVTRSLAGDPDNLVREELAEFASELENAKPANAALWVRNWMANVQAIYAFQILNATNSDERWDAVDAVRRCLFDALGGIIQADGEGFSNEEGYHIVWQFSDKVTGSWHVAVLSDDGNWKNFKMDLGNAKHREAFWNGKVPT